MPALCGAPGQDGGHGRGAHDARALDRRPAAGERDVERDEREDEDEPPRSGSPTRTHSASASAARSATFCPLAATRWIHQAITLRIRVA